MSHYRNARRILPPDLLGEVQKYASGMLWIPPARITEARKRNAVIVQAVADGEPVLEVAKLMGISERRAYQLIREQRIGGTS